MTEHLPDIGEEQKQQLMAKTLQEGMNAWDYVQSRVQTDQHRLSLASCPVSRKGIP